MREISPKLLSKLKSNEQTHYNNAENKMKITVKRSLNEMFIATTIHTRENLKELDTTLKRDHAGVEPDTAYTVYLENGIVKVASKILPPSMEGNDWIEEFTIGPGQDAAIEFDGYWSLDFIKDRRYNFVTTDIWVFWLNNQTLWGQKWNDLNTQVILATGVLKIAALRGWKGDLNPIDDHGLIVAYIKNGEVYYRNYAQQSTGVLIWEEERKITQLPNNVVNIALFRANDYRVGVIAERNIQGDENELYWVITERNFASFGAIDEAVRGRVTELVCNMLLVQYIDGFEDEHIDVEVQDLGIWMCIPFYPNIVQITNPNKSETTILIEFSHPIHQSLVGLQGRLEIRDRLNIKFNILSTHQGTNERFLQLNTLNFASASGNLTITYDNVHPAFNFPWLSTLSPDGCFFEITDFPKSFLPDLTPPVAYVHERISAAAIELNIGFINAQHLAAQENESIRVFVNELTIALLNIHTDPI